MHGGPGSLPHFHGSPLATQRTASAIKFCSVISPSLTRSPQIRLKYKAFASNFKDTLSQTASSSRYVFKEVLITKNYCITLEEVLCKRADTLCSLKLVCKLQNLTAPPKYSNQFQVDKQQHVRFFIWSSWV